MRQQRTKGREEKQCEGAINFVFQFCKALKCGPFGFCILFSKYIAKTKKQCGSSAVTHCVCRLYKDLFFLKQ